ncbi:hypothetical protein ANN_13529 [Periplaneta americana]|uniref:Uncharacterized protein n=1 Tax=Periplaneta americana TaxID=6978 RepID=A0ABQ8TJM7_PERAM|nr:hypothetical protein ANN_13529 [Periplaneta americana]
MIRGRDEEAMAGEDLHIDMNCVISQCRRSRKDSFVCCSMTRQFPFERIPNLTGEQSDGITVFRIPPMTSLMLHRCRTGAINLQRWWQSPSAAISESDWFLHVMQTSYNTVSSRQTQPAAITQAVTRSKHLDMCWVPAERLRYCGTAAITGCYKGEEEQYGSSRRKA